MDMSSSATSLIGLSLLTLVASNYIREPNDDQESSQESYLNDISSGSKVNVTSQKKFHLRSEELTWVEALIKCYSLNMRLASIEKQEEQDHVVAIIRNTDRSKGYQSGYWISGSDLSGYKMFKWMTTGKPLAYKNWGTGEPNNNLVQIPPYTDVEHCVSLNDRSNFKWSDNACSQRKYFICEQEVNQKIDVNQNQKSLQKEHYLNNPSSDVKVKFTSRKRFQLGSKKEEITWIEALVKCHSMNMRLATIESQEEQEHVVSMIREEDAKDDQHSLPSKADPNDVSSTFKKPDSRRTHTQKRFQLVCKELTWLEALVECYSMDMRLASIESQEEQKLLVAMIEKSGCSPEDVWVAGSDLNGNRTFKWMTTGKPLTYESWKSGEPNHHLQELTQYEDVEHCLSLNANFSYNWNDNACSSQMNFVCENQV